MTPNQQFMIAMITACTALLGVVLSRLVPVIRNAVRSSGKGQAKLPSYRQLVEDVGKLKEEFAQYKQATGNVFSDARRQWPSEYNPPRFDPADLQVLIPSGVVPRTWRRPRLISGNK